VGVVSFVVRGWNSSHLAAALSAEYGIGVRDGLFCAHPLVRHLLGATSEDLGACGSPDPAAGFTGNAIRVSFGAGTPEADVPRFLAALAALTTEGPAWTYATRSGRCVPIAPRVPSAPGGLVAQSPAPLE
jgi:selenocysteine lyase/cysteine desulfurase